MRQSEMDEDDAASEEKSELEALLSSGRKSRKYIRSEKPDEDWLLQKQQAADLQLQRRAALYSCKDFKDFTWRRHKGQVRCISGACTVLLTAVFVLELLQHKVCLTMGLPLALCIALSVLLLYLVCVNYDRSRQLCQAIAPALVLMALLTWFLPNLVCVFSSNSSASGCERDHAIAVFFVSILPLLVSSASIMALNICCALSGLILALILSAGAFQSRRKDWESVMVLSPIVYLFSVLLSYRSYCSEKELFSLMVSFKKTVACSELYFKEAKMELENVMRDSSDRIAKMRQFISYIFHEIRVPFNAVVLGIGHLLATNISEEQQEVLKMMDSSSSSMIRILNDVLDMGKIESGKLQLEKQPFNLAELVSSLIWAFKDTLESKGLDFSLCVDDCTKEFLSSHDLVGDKHRIRQVLANYLSNATKFTPRGGRVKLHIVWNRIEAGESLVELSSQAKQEILEAAKKKKFASVTVSVEDTGIGISKDDQSRLFEPYMQVHAGSAQQSHGGTGLGLSFAKRIVELAGGKIGVFSDTGKGSVFSFTVPFEVAGPVLAEGKAADDVLVNPFDLPLESRIETSGCCFPSNTRPLRLNPKVLIVEDNLLNRRILKKLLASFNIESDAVEDGQQAVELCRSGAQYDMILIDKEMPVMDGHEATRAIRAMGVKTTIVGLTGNALDSDRNQFLAAGVNDFFTKPLSRHQLLRLLEAYGLVSSS